MAGDCAICHATPGQADARRLGVGRKLRTAFGTFYMPNISSDPVDGIGRWTEMDWIRSFYEAARVQARAKSIEMPVFDAFWNSDDALAFPIEASAQRYVRHADFRADPFLNALGTALGRIEIFSQAIEKMGYDDCPPHPRNTPARRLPSTCSMRRRTPSLSNPLPKERHDS